MIYVFLLMIYLIIQGIIEGQLWEDRKLRAFGLDYHTWRFFESALLFFVFFSMTGMPIYNFLGYFLIGNWIYDKFLHKVLYNNWAYISPTNKKFHIFNIDLPSHKYIYEMSLIPAIILIWM